jgi:uncharacterized membrane protein YedE/YeeE
LSHPWPWYVAGPLIGLMVPIMVLLKRRFGISTSMRHMCAAAVPSAADWFRYDWRKQGGWNLLFVAGIFLGGVLAATFRPGGDEVAISPATRAALEDVGIRDFTGMSPVDIFAWRNLGTLAGFLSMVVGGFLVGFGARVADGCTSGHAITGMAEFKASSLVTVAGFFAGGLFITYVVLPVIL